MRRVESDVVNQGWISLQEAGVFIDRNTLTARLVKALRTGLQLFEQEGLTPYLPRWEKLDNFINRPVKLIIGDKEIFGISRGIDAQGALLLEQDGVIKPWVEARYRCVALNKQKGACAPFFISVGELDRPNDLRSFGHNQAGRSLVGNIFSFKFSRLISFHNEVAILTASSFESFA